MIVSLARLWDGWINKTRWFLKSRNMGGQQLTVLPLVVTMVALVPFISFTSPSIHASSGSSAHTCDPTMMFTGLPWIIQTYTKESILRNKRKRKRWSVNWNKPMIRKLTITTKLHDPPYSKQNEHQQMTLWSDRARETAVLEGWNNAVENCRTWDQKRMLKRNSKAEEVPVEKPKKQKAEQPPLTSLPHSISTFFF